MRFANWLSTPLMEGRLIGGNTVLHNISAFASLVAPFVQRQFVAPNLPLELSSKRFYDF